VGQINLLDSRGSSLYYPLHLRGTKPNQLDFNHSLKVEPILPLPLMGPSSLRPFPSSKVAPKYSLLFYTNFLVPARKEPKCSPEKRLQILMS
jgi:hypothetical protein